MRGVLGDNGSGQVAVGDGDRGITRQQRLVDRNLLVVKRQLVVQLPEVEVHAKICYNLLLMTDVFAYEEDAEGSSSSPFLSAASASSSRRSLW